MYAFLLTILIGSMGTLYCAQADAIESPKSSLQGDEPQWQLPKDHAQRNMILPIGAEVHRIQYNHCQTCLNFIRYKEALRRGMGCFCLFKLPIPHQPHFSEQFCIHLSEELFP